MSRTARPSVSRRLAGTAGAAAVVALTACGGPGDGSETQAPAPTASRTAAQADGVTDFCDQAAGIDDRVDAALSGLDGGNPSIADAFRRLAGQLRGIDAPEPITTAWAELSAGLDRMADAFADVDITDLDSLEALDQAQGDVTTASTEVENYLDDECGL
jgi:hypothetical protein